MLHSWHTFIGLFSSMFYKKDTVYQHTTSESGAIGPTEYVEKGILVLMSF